ncbi:hypothetical protein [Microlunatus speluncae]|uniref:hypothetical protein n=1 Tax=Microlunatus speluncae TaxID=2594267 RepID=UPI001FEB320D|nr:hypothetical protein [Microlunatus speluncae]
MITQLLEAATTRWSFEPVRTRWLDPTDRLDEALAEHLPVSSPGDTLVISEKVAVLLTGGAIPVSDYRPGRWARILARCVQPRQGSRGLSIPEKMEYVIAAVGLPRVLVAAAAAAITRPLGRHGEFYRIAGPIARDLDGGRPPYEHLLFPPLDPVTAQQLCDQLEDALDRGVAIIDLNDFGGTIRATSRRAPATQTLHWLLRANPLGQRSTGTPFGLIRQGVRALATDGG